MTGRRVVPFALLLVTAVLLGGVAPAVASPPPTPTPFCERPLSEALSTAAPNATVESTHATVAIDGRDAVWTVEATVDNDSAVSRLLRNETLRRRVVEGASADVSPDAVGVAAAGPRTLAFAFRTEGVVARTPGNVSRLDAFHVRGDRFRLVSCDRLTVVGPPGTTLATHPQRADGGLRADGNRVVVGENADASGSFFVFAPATTPGVLREAFAALALALAVGGTVLRNAAVTVCLPATVLAGEFIVLHRLFAAAVGPHRREFAREVGSTVLGLAVVGAVPLLWFLGVWDAAFVAPAVGLAAGGLTATFGFGTGADRGSFAAVLGVVATGVAAAASVAAGLLTPRPAVAATCLVVPVLAGHSLGVAASAGRPARPAAAAATLGFAAGLVAQFYPLTAASGPMSGLLVVVTLLAAVGLAVAAVPFALVGAGREE